MDSFNFDALDSAALDETLSFLNDYDPSTLPDASSPGFENFGEPMMGWPVDQANTWAPLGDAYLSGGGMDALTDTSTLGFQVPGHNYNLGNQAAGESFDELSEVATLGSGFSTSQMGSSYFDGGRWQLQRSSSLGASIPVESRRSIDAPQVPCLTCDWPSCKITATYATTHDLQHHQTDVHVAKVLNAWPGKCSWPGCESKIFFETSKRLESHVYNVHITPLCCTVAGCKRMKPFERQADLERHIESLHSGNRKYKCPHPRCRWQGGFSRKDKLRLHEKTHHGQFKCPANHCVYGFQSEVRLLQHQKRPYWSTSHFRYECGIGSCGRTSLSQFNRVGLVLHLQFDHLISLGAIQNAIGRMPVPEWSLTLPCFPNGFTDYRDCKSCVEKLMEAASGEEVQGSSKTR